MNHEELFNDNLLKRIPMASIVMAINLAMEHVPTEYVVGHLAFQALQKWVMTGKGKERLLVLRPTLHDEVERARKLFVKWEEARTTAPTLVTPEKKKSAKQKKKDEQMERGPLYAYMTVRALEAGVNVALGADTSELVDLLECIDDVPSVSGADPGKVESLTSVLQSLDQVFDRAHWKDIVNAA